jgi:hypothetical protein
MPEKNNETGNVMRRVINVKSVTELLRTTEKLPSLPSLAIHLESLRVSKGIKKEHLFVNANISSPYGHEVLRGTKRPSRDKLIQFAIGLALNVEQTQHLLQIGNQAVLYPKMKRDALICYALTNKFTVTQTDALLFDGKFPMLGDY